MREDLLGVLLDSGLSDSDLRDEIITLLLAGHETTANALTWTWVLLAQHPEIAERVVAECDAFDPIDAALKRDGLPFTTAVLNEAMRLYPPVFSVARSTLEPLELGGVALPAGATVMLPIDALHHSPRYWTDPERFDPDRFLPDAVAERDRYAYLPFGGGPRSCIGEHFAILEAVLALAVLLRRFEVTTDAASVPMRYGITQRADASVFAGIRPAVAASRTT